MNDFDHSKAAVEDGNIFEWQRKEMSEAEQGLSEQADTKSTAIFP